MRTRLPSLLPLLVGLFLAGSVHADPDLRDTRLLAQPAVSEGRIAFIYADDLWIADIDGHNVRRLTTDPGIESNPVFSPDGQTIAFSAQYDGNTDVFVIPVTGGPPKRLTSHPSPDIVRGWTPDGSAVLFSSPRNASNNRHTQLYTVPVAGGMPAQLPIPYGVEASFSPDGDYIAYCPLADRSAQWKHYRGGTTGHIWIYNVKDHSIEQVPQPPDRCNDLAPQWVGKTIYFRSDRAGEYNLFGYDPVTKKVRQLTDYKDFPVVALGSGGGHVIFEQAGYLNLFNTEKETYSRLKIGVATDVGEARPRYVKGAKYIRNGGISPSGARAVFEFRGEIVTVPAEKGDPHNLTETPGVNERSPAWSPDGRSIAYFSDDGGEYKLHVRAANGKGKAKVYDAKGAGFYENPTWSPDSKKIAYIDNSQSLFWIDLADSKVKKVASEVQYAPQGMVTLRPAWSPDSRWITYALSNKVAYHTVYAYDTTTDKARAITDGLSDALDPVFDAGGQYLYFFASTDAGPVNNWFAQSSADMQSHRSIYLVVLKKDETSPLTKESDEEKPKEEKPAAKPEKPKDVGVAIDFDGIDQRILALPEPAGHYRDLASRGRGSNLLPGRCAIGRWPDAGRSQAFRPVQAQERDFDAQRRRL